MKFKQSIFNKNTAFFGGILFCMVLFIGMGCGQTREGERNLNHQNIGASEIQINELQNHDPDLGLVGQAATDINTNSKQMEKSMGSPEIPQSYTPQNSETARATHQQAVDNPPEAISAASGLLGLLGNWFPWAAAAGNGLLGMWALGPLVRPCTCRWRFYFSRS